MKQRPMNPRVHAFWDGIKYLRDGDDIAEQARERREQERIRRGVDHHGFWFAVECCLWGAGVLK
jgi:hypothetical protein